MGDLNTLSNVDPSLEQYRRIAAKYDRKLQVRLGEATRRKAFARFDLRPGDTVLDVGCGTGLSFSLIEEGIGSSGRLIAIEPSPEMAAIARARVRSAGWDNVEFVEAPAETAQVPPGADVVIIFRVHDVLRSRAALCNVFGSAKAGARVFVVGVKWAPWWAFPLNAALWVLTRPVTTTHEGFDRPWGILEDFVTDLHVQSLTAGTQFIASARTRLE